MTANTIFRKDIQGLRAIAVVSVIIFHIDGGWLRGGFIGVDIFFVISGFLITSILLKDFEQKTYTLVDFYKRRLRRLLPALVAMLTFCVIAGLALLAADDMRKLGLTLVSTLIFSSNIVFYLTSDYFGGSAEFQPLLHTWSLAVEEQFYILFPLVLFGVWKFWRRYISQVIVILALISLWSSVTFGQEDNAWGFYLPFSRAYELLLGSLVATSPKMPFRLSTRVTDVISVVGLVLIAASLIFIDQEQILFPGFIALVPCVGTAIIIAAGRGRESFGGKLISGSSFQFFGNLSYSLYLWHWPILVFARHFALGQVSPVASLLLMILATGVAWASYAFVERKFVRGFPDLPVLRLSAGVCVVFIAIGVAAFLTDGFASRFSKSASDMARSAENFNPERKACHFDGTGIQPYSSTCTFGGETPSVAVWGDSHGAELAYVLGQELGAADIGVREITTSACPPAMGFVSVKRPDCADQNEETLNGLKSDASIGTVILIAALEGYGTERLNGIESGLRRSVEELILSGKNVVLVGPIPNQEYDPPAALSLTVYRKQPPENWGRPRAEVDEALPPFRSMIARVAEATGASVVDPTTIICGPEICPAFDTKAGVLYFNMSHLSLAGARLVGLALASQYLHF